MKTKTIMTKRIKIILILIFFIFLRINISKTTIPLRGIVEGFYGKPWNYNIRVDMIKFCGEYKLNSYIYAPKDDPYHREKWREPYPDDKINELKNLVDIAIKNNVHFIFAISPGLNLNYEGEKGEEDFQYMLNKLDSMYNIGIRDFAIFFDDLIEEQSGSNQANFLNKLQNSLINKYLDMNYLLTVPTYYTRKYMININGEIEKYTHEFSSILNKNIIVLYTGENYVCDGISERSFQEIKKIYGKNLGIWWNYPVNDYIRHNSTRFIKLALGPIEKLPRIKVGSIFFNPMGQPILSKISIATGADYALSPYTYDPITSWNKVIEKQFGELAPAMKVFASHSQHMETDYVKTGPDDAPEFYYKAHQAVLDTMKGKYVVTTKLNYLIDEMENSANILLEKLPSDILNECELMLEQFKRIANADRLAVQSLKNHKLGPELKNLRQEIKNNESKAMISELSAVRFIDEVIQLYE